MVYLDPKHKLTLEFVALYEGLNAPKATKTRHAKQAKAQKVVKASKPRSNA